ncbi:phosphatidylinositol-glycan biosynthesis class F protein-like [Tropilaelaps mercedesae]|uniref:Phosphatidylinositol-glycan biosynthesis class F protein-like n=1 Tax=Tropilaelaps mercedesae TaxID=418985 RepID=A0A1V9XXX6_9ACAR|nr:phosphatidylinositol-glycan biosynthesis class F protein-like [Tropilaelaps mercedesae]
MDLQGSPRLTLIYHCVSAFLLSSLLLPGVLGSLLVADPNYGLPLLLLAVTCVQAGTLWWFNKNVASNFNPKQVSAETYSRCAAVFLLSIFTLHVTLVLFGAPLLDDILETFYLACFIALLGSLPIAICTECNAQEIDRLFFRRRPENVCERSLLYVVACTLMGCWLGALPIPLDWEAPWQRWPLTCVMASIGGAVAGHVAHAAKTVVEGRPEPKGGFKGKSIRA